MSLGTKRKKALSGGPGIVSLWTGTIQTRKKPHNWKREGKGKKEAT